jgi:glutathione synthase
LKHVFIMDPLGSVKSWKDTTYFLMKACRERDHEVGYADPAWLSLHHDRLHARVQWLEVNDSREQPFTLLDDTAVALEEVDVVWLRTDPPFDRRYLYTTLLLDFLPESTRVVNRPQGVRDWNEKLAALVFPQFTPPTLVSNNAVEIAAFADGFERITVKPVDGYGGKGILFHRRGDDVSGLQTATRDGAHWVIAQAYLPAARQGDKRILLLQGEPLGAILRLHAEGEELNNLDQGGSANPSSLTRREMEICRAFGPELIRRGLFFVGIDVIGDMLIEVNVTSPTGLQEMSRFNDEPLHHRIIEALE